MSSRLWPGLGARSRNPITLMKRYVLDEWERFEESKEVVAREDRRDRVPEGGKILARSALVVIAFAPIAFAPIAFAKVEIAGFFFHVSNELASVHRAADARRVYPLAKADLLVDIHPSSDEECFRNGLFEVDGKEEDAYENLRM